MPIITPAYPAYNSADKATISTLQVMMRELARGVAICAEILKEPDVLKHDWSHLFQPSDFFIRYDSYLVLEVSASTDEDNERWGNYVESRLRGLIEGLERADLPLAMIHMWHKGEKRVENITVEVPIENEEDEEADYSGTIAGAAAADANIQTPAGSPMPGQYALV